MCSFGSLCLPFLNEFSLGIGRLHKGRLNNVAARIERRIIIYNHLPGDKTPMGMDRHQYAKTTIR